MTVNTDNFKPGFVRRLEATGGKDTHDLYSRIANGDWVQETGWCQVDKYDDDAVAYVTRKLGEFGPPAVESYDPVQWPPSPKKTHFDQLNIKPYESLVVPGNALTTQGLGQLTNFLIGTGSLVGLTATTTRLGVGDGVTAFAAADTDLSAVAGSTHRWYQIVDSAPARVTTTVTNDSVQCVATFATGDGNFVWNEWALNTSTATPASSNAVIAGTFWNRKVASLGTKVSGAWALTVKIAFA
jgi:hypothetical protein